MLKSVNEAVASTFFDRCEISAFETWIGLKKVFNMMPSFGYTGNIFKGVS